MRGDTEAFAARGLNIEVQPCQKIGARVAKSHEVELIHTPVRRKAAQACFVSPFPRDRHAVGRHRWRGRRVHHGKGLDQNVIALVGVKPAEAPDPQRFSGLPRPGLGRIGIGGEDRPGDQLFCSYSETVESEGRHLRAVRHPQIGRIRTPAQEPLVPRLEKGIMLPAYDRDSQPPARDLAQQRRPRQRGPDRIRPPFAGLFADPAIGSDLVAFTTFAHERIDASGLQPFDRVPVSPGEREDTHACSRLCQCGDDLRQRGLRAAALHRIDDVGYPHHKAPFRRAMAAAMASAARWDAGTSDSAKVCAISRSCSAR